MANLSLTSNFVSSSLTPHHPHRRRGLNLITSPEDSKPLQRQRGSTLTITCGAKSGGGGGGGGNPFKSIINKCKSCGGQGAIECPGCKGTGKNKKNGNIFERWKCYDCQGFGLKSCPACGTGGLTPEQRGER
nr:protein PHOTOSYSTEM I ASSEMBLY 2, chloroplastic isoform X1 [Ipomoea batatas]